MQALKRQLILIISDILFTNLAFLLSALLILPIQQFTSVLLGYFWEIALFITMVRILTNYIFGLYSSLWRYASVDELFKVIVSVTVGSVMNFVFLHLIRQSYPFAMYASIWMLNLFFIAGSRFTYRALRKSLHKKYNKNIQQKNVLIYGAGDAGVLVLNELRRHPEMGMHPVVMIDDDPAKYKRKVNGILVFGARDKIQDAVKKYQVEEILIALPSVTKQEHKQIIEICKGTGCKLKTLPGVYELINGKVDIKKIREVNIEDLLGREPVKLNSKEISEYLKGETILVTGGGGTIGSEICRQISYFQPKKLMIFDIYENNAYSLQLELKKKHPDLDLEVLIGSVRDKGRLDFIFQTYRPTVVFHAAAHKHVPLMEDSPTEAIKNNVFGTINVAEAAKIYQAKKFVLISTDKAVNPTNIMGATKRIAEIVIQMMDRHSKNTDYVAVRFGNVLGSNGSVIPIFKKQIAEGGPVTVTHPDIIRYFMTITEASQLVLQAGAMAKGGEIFILDMGEPVKILDLAKDLIKLSGFTPDEDIKIEFTGLRPGEKLYEELLIAEEGLQATKHKKILISKPIDYSYQEFVQELAKLKEVITKDAVQEIPKVIKKIVPTFQFDDRNKRQNSKKEKEEIQSTN
ncbi:polysaccharide biosynthesis protein [Garciella nitratireducens]|uniref:polysaccharide biosynthesis protein n=1 Tax=Garciella nitratireducens TaxID=218205 RepID=UPI000DE98D72|nr:nucleoside-diphosphate sugar epimerase/dehydratase [Garciella nitratireducens]RBP42231.1 FlaA1/EpsC-like NDP-sugar epimerase [Garciella nitratireducens]